VCRFTRARVCRYTATESTRFAVANETAGEGKRTTEFRRKLKVVVEIIQNVSRQFGGLCFNQFRRVYDIFLRTHERIYIHIIRDCSSAQILVNVIIIDVEISGPYLRAFKEENNNKSSFFKLFAKYLNWTTWAG